MLSPCAFLAQIYFLLPRVATSMDAHSSLPISARATKWVFITADVTTVLAQLAGTALTITFGDLVRIGKWVGTLINPLIESGKESQVEQIVTGGLWVQLVFFLTFIGIFVSFARSAKRHALLEKKATVPVKWNQTQKGLLYAMAIACILLLVSLSASVRYHASPAFGRTSAERDRCARFTVSPSIPLGRYAFTRRSRLGG